MLRIGAYNPEDCPRFNGWRDVRRGELRLVECEVAMGWPGSAVLVKPSLCRQCQAEADPEPLKALLRKQRNSMIRRCRDLLLGGRARDAVNVLRVYETVQGAIQVDGKTAPWDQDPDYLRDERGRFQSEAEWAAFAGRRAAQDLLLEAVRTGGMAPEAAEAVSEDLWPQDTP